MAQLLQAGRLQRAKLAGVYREAIRHEDAQRLYALPVVEAVAALGCWDIDTLRVLGAGS